MISRRHIALGLAGAGAAAAGAGVFVWRQRQRDAAKAALTGGFWQQQFEAPAGGVVAPAAWQGQPVLLNFWATWCGPCVREMPEIDRFAKEHATKGWRVLGLAIDSPTPVREFLAKSPVSYPIGLAGLEGSELARLLGNEHGTLPYTVAFGSDGLIKQRKVGATNFADLSQWAQSVT